MTVGVWLGVFVLANLIMVAVVERRSRRLQWEKFTALLRSVDPKCRSAGWVINRAEFRPGWRWGHGLIVWRRGRDTFRSPVRIDAAETTREAAKPW